MKRPFFPDDVLAINDFQADEYSEILSQVMNCIACPEDLGSMGTGC